MTRHEQAIVELQSIIKRLDEDKRDLQNICFQAVFNIRDYSIDEMVCLIFREYTMLSKQYLPELQYPQMKSLLYMEIYSKVNKAIKIKNSAKELRSALADDILDRFDNEEHWDPEIITNFVRKHVGDHNEEDVQAAVLEYLDSPDFNLVQRI
jgi:hypothetical protein